MFKKELKSWALEKGSELVHMRLALNYHWAQDALIEYIDAKTMRKSFPLDTSIWLECKKPSLEAMCCEKEIRESLSSLGFGDEGIRIYTDDTDEEVIGIDDWLEDICVKRYFHTWPMTEEE